MRPGREVGRACPSRELPQATVFQSGESRQKCPPGEASTIRELRPGRDFSPVTASGED
jgi:hypothetical protein